MVRLKPIYTEIGRTLRQLRSAPPSDAVQRAIDRLEQCQSEINMICGPTMDIPIRPTTAA
ncbi:MAG TPA: hypothetical protein VH458_22620 [Vicinamibacterales bacterium]